MPRKLRLEFPGAMYHVVSRGDQREDIFLRDVDRYSRRAGSKRLPKPAERPVGKFTPSVSCETITYK